MILTAFLALQTSADGREAIDALTAIFYNEIFIGGILLALVASFFVGLFSKRAGLVMAGTTFVIAFMGLMSPWFVRVLQLVTRTSAI